MKRRNACMPLNVGEYLADTMHLNATEHGAYLLILMHLWCGGSQPSNGAEFMSITRTNIKVWREISGTILPLLRRADAVGMPVRPASISGKPGSSLGAPRGRLR